MDCKNNIFVCIKANMHECMHTHRQTQAVQHFSLLDDVAILTTDRSNTSI